jgi:hypothetical protein
MSHKKKLSPAESSVLSQIHELLLRYKHYIRYDQYMVNLNLMQSAIAEKNSAKLQAALLGLGRSEIYIPSAIDMTEEAGLCPKHAKHIVKQIREIELKTGAFPWEGLAEITESMLATV